MFTSGGANGGWTEWTTSNGRKYYHHAFWKITQWQMPPGFQASTLTSHTHDRERRGERSICRVDLQAAVKYGNREALAASPGQRGEHRWRYHYNQSALSKSDVLACGECSKQGLSDHHGRVDYSNGIFYCFECWALFEEGVDYAESTPGGAAQSTHGTTAAPVSARHRLLLLSMLNAGQSAGHTVQSIAVHEEIAQFGNTRQRCRVRCSWSLTVRLLLFRRPGQRRGRPEAAARTTREDCKLLLFMNPC